MATHAVVMLSNQADPTVLYRQADRKMRLLLGREYGKEVHKTLFINMEEARNGHRFIDQTSALGLQDAALWNVSCVSGGRRARTYGAMRLCHLTKIEVEEVTECAGSKVLMVSFGVEFADEKYMDDRGARRCCESFAGWSDVWNHACLSASYFLYPLLVYRDVFEGGNPLLTAKVGDVLSIKSECKDWFLFCCWEGDVPLDCVPLSPSAISDSTRKLLRRMGRPERGHRAHRSGAVSRALIMNLLKNKGMQIDGGLENVVVRWGGWSTKEGIATMKEVYESLLLDDFINVSGLAFGIGDENDVWEHRTKAFIGKVLTPTKAIYDLNVGAGKGGSVYRLPWLCRMRALRQSGLLRAAFAEATLALLSAAQGCLELVPVDRYQSIHGLLLDALEYFASEQAMFDGGPVPTPEQRLLCQRYHELNAAYVSQAQRCFIAQKQQLQQDYFAHAKASSCVGTLRKPTSQTCLQRALQAIVDVPLHLQSINHVLATSRELDVDAVQIWDELMSKGVNAFAAP